MRPRSFTIPVVDVDEQDMEEQSCTMREPSPEENSLRELMTMGGAAIHGSPKSNRFKQRDCGAIHSTMARSICLDDDRCTGVGQPIVQTTNTRDYEFKVRDKYDDRNQLGHELGCTGKWLAMHTINFLESPQFDTVPRIPRAWPLFRLKGLFILDRNDLTFDDNENNTHADRSKEKQNTERFRSINLGQSKLVETHEFQN
eukprot:3220380-Heterocapsa_arctica.AAC.1